MNPRFPYIYRRGCHSSSQLAGRAHGLLFLSAVLRGWYADGGLRSLSVSPDYLYNYTSFLQNSTLKYLKFVRCFVRKKQNQTRSNCAFFSSCTLFCRFSSKHAVKSAKNTSAASTEKTLLKIPPSPSAIESCPRPGLGQGQESVDNVNSIPKQLRACNSTVRTQIIEKTIVFRQSLTGRTTSARRTFPDGGRGIHPTNGASRGSRRGRRCESARPRFRGRPARRVRRSRPR